MYSCRGEFLRDIVCPYCLGEKRYRTFSGKLVAPCWECANNVPARTPEREKLKK